MAGCESPHEGVAPYGDDDHLDGVVLNQALATLDDHAGRSTPLAMMVSFYGPHAPYYLPEHWHNLYRDQDLPLPDDLEDPLLNKPEIQKTFRCRAWGETFDSAKWKRIRSAYFGYCSMIDHFIGRLLQRVDLETTAILFLSDHGEMNGHHGMLYKGPMMYEQLVRIPALLHLPGQNEARSFDGLVQTMDFTATLLDLVGAGTVPDGRSLLDPAYTGREYVISEFHEANWVTPIVQQHVTMVRDQRYKLVITHGQGEELYDLTEQPCEVINRIDDPAMASHRARLARQLR